MQKTGHVFIDKLVPFQFELYWDEELFHRWVQENIHLSWVFSIIYVIGIVVGRQYMRHRKRFDLQKPLAAWSVFLALFSIFGTLRMWPELLFLLYQDGFYTSICKMVLVNRSVTGFWGSMFTLSKVIEFGDTVFIVLRKQPLIFLHWYHHITVLLYVWYTYAEHAAPGKWFSVLNYTVHGFMYTYYAFRALKYRLPTWQKKMITGLQLSQMVVACGFNVYSFFLKTQSVYCRQSDENLLYSTLMYFSYLVLFAKFYHDAYNKPSWSTPLKQK